MRFLLVPLLIVACAPDAAEGEGEGEGEACGDVVNVFDADVCVASTATEHDLHVVGDGVDLTVSAFGDLVGELDETNSSCFAQFSSGADVFRVATGAIGGTPIGECHVVITARDDAAPVANGDGFAVKDGDNLADPLFFTLHTSL